MASFPSGSGLGGLQLPDSQGSDSSIDLSQGTLNKMLHDFGADNTVLTNTIIEEFHSHEDPIDGVDEERLVDSLSMQRVLLSTVVTPVTSPSCSQDQSSQHQVPPPTPLVVAKPVIRTSLPSNAPLPGQYSFGIVLNDEKPVSKTATFTYSGAVHRAYIKKDVIIGLAFTFNQPPPANAVIRVMAIHKTPELVGENVVCCLKHVEELNKQGLQNCRHFVRGAEQCQTTYHEDPISGRLSISMPVGSLQPNRDNQLQAFFKFPCYTSELKKGVGKLTQLIFTLEICSTQQVLGRAVLDARVCASPGRDRDLDETRLLQSHATSPVSPVSTPSPSGEGTSTTKRGRKRPAAITQSLEYSLPTKLFCNSSSQQKVLHTMEISKELIPFVEVCALMMEKLYAVKCQIDTDTPAPTPEISQQPLSPQDRLPITDVQSWLKHLGLSQYTQLFSANGVHSLSQVMDVSDQELIQIGVRSPQHRMKLMDGRGLIHLEPVEHEEDDLEDSQPISLGRSYSQLSSASSASSTVQRQTLEVLRIQLKKTYSNSSSSSNGTFPMDC